MLKKIVSSCDGFYIQWLFSQFILKQMRIVCDAFSSLSCCYHIFLAIFYECVVNTSFFFPAWGCQHHSKLKTLCNWALNPMLSPIPFSLQSFKNWFICEFEIFGKRRRDFIHKILQSMLEYPFWIAVYPHQINIYVCLWWQTERPKIWLTYILNTRIFKLNQIVQPNGHAEGLVKLIWRVKY